MIIDFYFFSKGLYIYLITLFFHFSASKERIVCRTVYICFKLNLQL